MLMMCALLVGTSLTAAAQTTYRRNGRTVTVYPNNRRVVRTDRGRTIVRRPNGRSVVVLPNGRRVVRSSRGRQSYPQVNRGRTYRTRDGRLVTVLPNGRRIYR
jgi:putative intracellular protease/amidase